MDICKKLQAIFNRKEKIKLVLLFFIMLGGALVETIGVSLIVPFINIVSDPGSLFKNELLYKIYVFIGANSTKDFIIFASLFLLATYLLKSIYLYFMYGLQYRFIYNQQIKVSKYLLKAYLRKPYTFHLQRNSAELLRTINIDTNNLFKNVITPILLITSEFLIVLGLLLLLLYVEPMTTMIAFVIMAGSGSLLVSFFRRKLKFLGKKSQESRGEMMKWANQGLGASKEIKVNRIETFFINRYSQSGEEYAKTVRYQQMMEQIPRLFIEFISVAGMLAVILTTILQGRETNEIIPVLALFAVASFRLMPSMNRINQYINKIIFHKPSLDLIYKDLVVNDIENSDTPNEEICNVNNKDKTTNSIDVVNVSYHYPNTEEYVIKNLSISIPEGKSVAFIGPSGSGKTTLADIVLGLLKPTEGKIVWNNLNIHQNLHMWAQMVGYIPQFIYLTDDTIRRNVAFGINDDEIIDEKVSAALEQSQLKEFVIKQPYGLDTTIGERGIKLSGGQRQRIGIARALYHNPEILVLDEATSSLDNKTEKEVMRAIDHLRGQKTMIIIAHRLSTIEKCDIIMEIEDGKVVSQKNN